MAQLIRNVGVMQALGNNVKKVRNDLGVTQEELAFRAGVKAFPLVTVR